MVSVSGFWFVSNRKKDINLEATNPIKSTYSMSHSIIPHICSKWPIFTLIFEFSGPGYLKIFGPCPVLREIKDRKFRSGTETKIFEAKFWTGELPGLTEF